ncbi:hypothetical protein chiPu_0018855 [Chiloscyllium punctatum]|uniref:Uncharacterized protein n=1 Tax=Chiloscyllium punctatum TaxID=137246 RepID=A0A401RQ04_CHIPU|nr:hypothetical protein [Chiloscyllium punctatum]
MAWWEPRLRSGERDKQQGCYRPVRTDTGCVETVSCARGGHVETVSRARVGHMRYMAWWERPRLRLGERDKQQGCYRLVCTDTGCVETVSRARGGHVETVSRAERGHMGSDIREREKADNGVRSTANQKTIPPQ